MTRAETVTDALHEQVATRLAGVQQRYTRIRRAVVEALSASVAPCTLPELLATDVSLSQSSTYRNLAVLEEVGVVRRVVHGANDHARYELAEELTEHHHHLICNQCGAVADVKLDDALESQLDRAFSGTAQAAGFVAEGHLIDIFGSCADCR